MGRYWLVKVPDAAMASAWMPLLETLRGDERLHGLEVVEIIPERRDSNWMERAIAAKLTEESPK
jgi:hypothetical protein